MFLYTLATCRVKCQFAELHAGTFGRTLLENEDADRSGVGLRFLRKISSNPGHWCVEVRTLPLPESLDAHQY